MEDVPIEFIALGGLGIGFGLFLLVRGFSSYGRAAAFADTTVARLSGLAVGEMAVSGTIEPAELALVAPLTSEPCVYYRARIDEHSGDASRTTFREERAVGFQVRDATGAIRVFPRGARFDVPDDLDERTNGLGRPATVRFRTGPSMVAGERDRATLVAELLTVRPAGRSPLDGRAAAPRFGGGLGAVTGASGLGGGLGSETRYREARLSPGDVVTILGKALPFAELEDPDGADEATLGLDPIAEDPDLAAQVAAHRAAGTLQDDPDEAWGNAAIPGFGIGRPVRAPEIDPAAASPTLATAEQAERAHRTFSIPPRALILAATADVPLVVADGTPSAAASREETRFLVGLIGACLAIGSAIFLALVVGGSLDGLGAAG